MYILNWNSDDWNKNILIEKIKDKNNNYFLQSMDLENELTNLSTIEIETVNRCNNDCSFCPVNRHADIRKCMYMEDSLFKKIIDDLESLNYSGVISLFSNNEPLLDKRIIDFIIYAKRKLPNATHALCTNGLLMDNQKYMQLIHHLDYLVIDNYNDEYLINENLEKAMETDDDYYGCKVYVHNRKKNQVLLNRGGLSPNADSLGRVMYDSPCVLPFIQMVVRPDGKVSRCCQDAYGLETLGDLNEQSIMEVWNGKKYAQLRGDLLHNRRNLSTCSVCDIVGLVNYYPNEWVGHYYHQLIKLIQTAKKRGKLIVLYKFEGYEYLIKTLTMYGIDVDYIIFNEEIDDYIDDKSFIVLDRFDYDVLKKLTDAGNQCIDNFVIFEKIYPDRNVRNINQDNHKVYIERIRAAAQEGTLLLWGAGVTAEKLMGFYHFFPTKVVDTYKAGMLFKNKLPIQHFDEIDDIYRYTILIAVEDYYVIMKQLQEKGARAKNIIIGFNLI